MPSKGKDGIWRHDKPTGDNGAKPDQCPNCGDYMDYDRASEADDFDDELAKDWDLDALQAEDPVECERLAGYLYYMPSYAICEECDIEMAYGPNYYFNPGTTNYDLPRPLTRAEQARAEAEAEREQARAAGQLRLL